MVNIPKNDDKDCNEILPGLGRPGTIETAPTFGAGTLEVNAKILNFYLREKSFI